MRRRSAVVAVVLVFTSTVITAGCGSDDSSDDSARTSVGETTTAAATNELIGTWSTENVCEDQVRAFQQAGLGEFVGEWIGGAEYPGQVPRGNDPCRGARPMEHSHSFGDNGSFASYDQNGQQVDEGSYKIVDDRTLTLGDPPVAVRYRVEGDTATFRVIPPDCNTKKCQEAAAYVLSVFFPRSYKRAD